MVLPDRENPPHDGPKRYLRGDEFLMHNAWKKKKEKKKASKTTGRGGVKKRTSASPTKKKKKKLGGQTVDSRGSDDMNL